MRRTILTHGLISGVIIILGIIITVIFPTGHNVWLGYLIMLVGLSSILLAIKSHRDGALGGVIKFWPAFLIGLAVALVASIAYVLIWEVYMAATHYTFMDNYTAHILARKQAEGLSGAAYAKLVAEMAEMRKNYANPLYRMPETFMEIFPVGVLVTLVSAALLRNPKFLPART
jgi:hypothetical protein